MKNSDLFPFIEEWIAVFIVAIVTTGEKSDGKYLQELIEKSQETGMEIETVIGDTAYSEKDNILYAKENEPLIVQKN